ncbi:hypothetical protein [Planococcus shixiaomingii]|uniref:hypothetical protein n=1 Tax=Planococcus shixiaomingii TaxID=3058393 RepID=UPI00262B4FBA|nr:hypothetical protein [Planococcus sp. N022]WKA53810.1 hypothetical protein QWY21_14210 [Planococcus sp. N022]
MFRKIIIFVSVFFFMTLILFAGMMYLKNEVEVYSDGGISLVIDKPTFFTIAEPKVTEQGSDITYEHDIHLLGLPLGKYTLVERTLDNGVKLLFEEVANTSWMPYVLSLNLQGLAEGKLKSWNEEPIPRAEDPVYGMDPTTNPLGTVEWNGHELLQGNLFVSRNLTLGNGDKVHELRHEITDFAFEDGVIQKNFWLPPKHKSQSWVILSTEALFETNGKENEWIEFAANNRQQQLNWLTPSGPYVKLALTDDPRTQLAYGLVPERTKGQTYKEWNETSPSLFFETMALNSQINQ